MPITTRRYMTLEDTIKKEAPDSKGVYALYAPNKSLIYYGRADKSVRDDLVRHHAGKNGPCTAAAWYFNFETTYFSRSREKKLLEEYFMQYASYPKCNEAEISR